MSDPSKTLPHVELEFEPESYPFYRWLVRSVSISETLSGRTETRVALYNTDLGVPDEETLLGTSAAIKLSRPGQGERWLRGIVTEVVSQGVSADHRRCCELVLEPAFQCLGRTNWQKWVDMTVPEILHELLNEELTPFRRPFEFRLTRKDQTGELKYPVREYCAQRAETTESFVRRLCAEEGLALWYDYAGTTERLIVSDANSQFAQAEEAFPVIPPGFTDEDTESVKDFHLTYRRVPSAVSVARFDYTRPQLNLLKTATPPEEKERPEEQPDAPRRVPGPELYDPTGVTLHEYDEHQYKGADVGVQAQSRLELARKEGAVGEGRSSILAIRPGLIVQLADVAGIQVPTDGRYLVTAVRHHVEIPVQGNQEQTVEYENTFTCIPSTAPFRPERLPRPQANGDHAVVAAVSDADSIHHDRFGRVKVKFSWDRTPGAPTEKDSGWIPVLSPWAGSQRGIQAIPRRGDVVVIHYDLADPDRPFVAGSIPTAVNQLLYDGDQKTVVAWRTQSQRLDNNGGMETTHFNELLMDDAAEHELLALRAGWDYRRTVLHDAAIDVHHDDRQHVAHDQSLNVGHHRTTTIGSKDKEGHATGQDDTTVVGTRILDVQGHDLNTVAEEHQLVVGGDRRTRIGKTERKAKDILTVHGSSETEIDENATIHVKKLFQTTVDGEWRLKQAGTVISATEGHVDANVPGWIRIVRGSVNIIVDEKDNVTVSTAQRVKVEAAEIAFVADKISLDGQQEVRLAVGPTEIKLDMQGASISGPKVSQTAESLHETTAPLIRHN